MSRVLGNYTHYPPRRLSEEVCEQQQLTLVVLGAGLCRIETFAGGIAGRGLLGLALRVLVLDDALAQLGVEHESFRAGVELCVGARLVKDEGLT